MGAGAPAGETVSNGVCREEDILNQGTHNAAKDSGRSALDPALPKRLRLREQVTIPNMLTAVRLLAIPFMCYYLYHIDRYPETGLCFFAAIWLTDLLDGWIARTFHQVSDLGKLFDPAVDKLFHFATGVTLCFAGRVPLWVPIFIAVKECLMVVGSMIFLRKKIVVYAHWIGKIATALYILAFALAIFQSETLRRYMDWIFIPATLCSLLAMLHYYRYFHACLRCHKTARLAKKREEEASS